MTDCKNTFIVDTGADISVFKRTKVHPDQMLDISNPIKIKGVTNGITSSIGLTNTIILVNGHELEHKFHIVNSDFPIPADGILGRDFLTKFKCNIDYADWTLTIRQNYLSINIPLNSSLEENMFHIPPRCEVIRQIDSLKNLRNEIVVVNKELKPGVFIARTIISSENPLVKIINTTPETVALNLSTVETINLDEFHIYSIENESLNKSSLTRSQLSQHLSQDIPKLIKRFFATLY